MRLGFVSMLMPISSGLSGQSLASRREVPFNTRAFSTAGDLNASTICFDKLLANESDILFCFSIMPCSVQT